MHVGMEDELIKDALYRRSFDSDYSSYLVHHFVWPALLDAHGRALTKGECVTRKAGDPVSHLVSLGCSAPKKNCINFVFFSVFLNHYFTLSKTVFLVNMNLQKKYDRLILHFFLI